MSDISMYRGDNKRINLTVTAGGAAYDLTGCTLTLTVRKYVDGAVIYTGTAAIDDAAGGTAHVEITPTASNDFPVGEFVYDVELTTADSKTYTVAAGSFTVLADVTRPAS